MLANVNLLNQKLLKFETLILFHNLLQAVNFLS